MMRLSAILFVLLLAAGCAKQGRPMGGPVDRTAPTVTAHTPAADATAVALATEITINFSEAMDRQRVEEAIFVAPNGTLHMSWEGRQLRIRPRRGLTAGRTYIVTVGTDARDLRSNRLEASFSFAFATGERLDSGQLKGRIINTDDAVQNGAYVWAYDLETFDGRTARDAPTYVTQTGADGSYCFERLAQSRYRVVGFVDGNRNQKPDAGEAVALPAADIDVAGEGVTSAGDQRLAERQTEPRIVQATIVNRRRVLLVTDQPIALADLQVELDPLMIEQIHADPLDARRLHIRTSLQQEGKTYHLRARLAGKLLAVLSEPLRGTAREDTKAPTMSRTEPDGSVAAAAGISLFFSEQMDTTRVAMGWTSADSTSAPSGHWAWSSWTDLRFTPDRSLVPGQQRLDLRLQGLRDRAGNAMTDSTMRISFDLLDSTALGMITGQALWPGETAGRGRIRLAHKPRTAVMLTAADSTAAAFGHFRFTSLVPGEYLLTAWFDRDDDGLWDAGQVEPFRAAEPYALYGTVKLAAGDKVSLVVPKIEEVEE